MQLGALQIFSWFKMKASGTIRVVINTMSVHREGVEPNSVDGPDHHHDHIAQNESKNAKKKRGKKMTC